MESKAKPFTAHLQNVYLPIPCVWWDRRELQWKAALQRLMRWWSQAWKNLWLVFCERLWQSSYCNSLKIWDTSSVIKEDICWICCRFSQCIEFPTCKIMWRWLKGRLCGRSKTFCVFLFTSPVNRWVAGRNQFPVYGQHLWSFLKCFWRRPFVEDLKALWLTLRDIPLKWVLKCLWKKSSLANDISAN